MIKKQELTEAVKSISTEKELIDYLLGLPETEFESLPLAPIKKWTKEHGVNITGGELGKLLNLLIELEKKRPHFEKIGNAVISPVKWLIKNIIEIGAFGMIFAGSGEFKTFLTIAAACCIATGNSFYGHAVKKGAVYYIASEGSSGIIRRFRAWSQENTPIKDAPIYEYKGAVNLIDGAEILIRALENAIDEEAEPPLCAIIDTWSRSLGGDDSNTDSASAALSKIDTIRAKFPGLAIIIIHHTGHQEKHRARGASLIHAAVDCEFRMEKNKEGVITFTNTKSKESELMPPMAFKAKKVILLSDDGSVLKNEDGDAETSIVLEAVEYMAPYSGMGLGKNQERVLEVLNETSEKNMSYEDLLSVFKKQYGLRKDSLDKAILGLKDKGMVCSEVGFICLT